MHFFACTSVLMYYYIFNIYTMISDISNVQRGAGVHGAGAGPSRGAEDYQEAGWAAHRHGLPVRTHAPLLILPRQGDFSYDIHDQ